MANRITKVITLPSSDVSRADNNRLECPVCLNGSAYLSGIIEEDENNELLFVCERCGTKICVPYVDFHDEPLEA